MFNLIKSNRMENLAQALCTVIGENPGNPISTRIHRHPVPGHETMARSSDRPALRDMRQCALYVSPADA